jgi:cell division protein FtsN
MHGLRHEILKIDKPLAQSTNTSSQNAALPEPDLKINIDSPDKSAAVLQTTEVKEERNGSGHWVIHAFSVREQEGADFLKAQLIAAGYPAYTIPAKVHGRAWIRVRVGIFNSTDEAKKVADTIQKKGLMSDGPYWIAKISAKEKESIFGK